MRFRLSAIILVLCLSIGIAASTVFASTEAPAPPGQAAQDNLRGLVFQRAVVKVPFGAVVGTYYDGFFRTARGELRWGLEVGVDPDELNAMADAILRFHQYATADGSGAMFDDTVSAKSVYLLGAVISNLQFNAYGFRNSVDASLTVQWQLYDPASRKVVFAAKTEGRVEDSDMTTSAILAAFGEALGALLTDARFKSALKAPADTGTGQLKKEEQVNVRANSTPGPSELPQNLDKATSATVTIRVGHAIGTGAIVSADGYVLTARHVVAGVQEVLVTLKSGVTLPAKVVRTDPVQDVALLKLPGTGFTAFPLELKSREPVGSEVYAIGTPASEELSFSVSRGIVSGYRELDGCWYLQTDASVSPGYSGGPLVNQQGRLVGITSWKIVEQGFEGLSFGIPLDVVATSLGIKWE